MTVVEVQYLVSLYYYDVCYILTHQGCNKGQKLNFEASSM